MSYVDFAELKRSVTIEQVLLMLNISLKKSGEQLRGCCPIHAGSNPREFVVTPSKGLFFCFGKCGGGDMIKLAALVRKIDQKQAAQEIAAHFGNSTVPPKGTVTSGTVSTAPQNEKAGLNPLTYLMVEHECVQALGLEPVTARHFGAGYAPKGIMRGRLAIPIHDRWGKLLAYCGRTVKDESPTLIFPNGFDPTSAIFNAHQVTDGELYLVRDPLQVLTAFEAGIENVVAFLTEGITAQQLEQLSSLMDEKKCDSVQLY